MSRTSKPVVGLALGSGAARGWAHVGAMRALCDLGVRPDVICGTSVGALIGGFYLSGHLDALEEWARKLTKLRILRYVDPGLRRNGLIAGNRLFNDMERYISDVRIEDLPIPFAAVATDLFTGHEVWLTSGRLIDAIRASFSLPGLFEPVEIDGRWVVDGAIVNPVPISACHALGAQVTIAINLNSSSPARNGAQSRKRSGAAGFDVLPRWTGMVLRRNGDKAAAAEREDETTGAPSLLNVLASTLNIIQDRVTRSRLAAEPPDLNLVPKVGHIGLLDFHRAAEAIAAGEAAIRQAESEIGDAMMLLEAHRVC